MKGYTLNTDGQKLIQHSHTIIITILCPLAPDSLLNLTVLDTICRQLASVLKVMSYILSLLYADTHDT
jgi:hypothetical protein